MHLFPTLMILKEKKSNKERKESCRQGFLELDVTSERRENNQKGPVNIKLISS